MQHGVKGAVMLGAAMLIAGAAAAQMGAGGHHPGDGPFGQGRRGQGPEMNRRGGPGRFIEKMFQGDIADDLGLKDEQITRLKKGLERLKDREEKLHDKLRIAGKEQAEQLSTKGKIDEEALMNAIEKTGRIRTQMAKLRIQPIILVKKTLTEEQIEMARDIMKARMRERRRKWARNRHKDNDADVSRRGRGRRGRWRDGE